MPTPNISRDEILDLLERFARQRPGLEYGNYRDAAAYRSELRSITRDLADVRTLLAAVRWRESITAADLLAATRNAFMGRLSIEHDAKGRAYVAYCTGQYWPTEYRRAVAAVLASALWSAQAESLPYAIERRGDVLRAHFRREYGRGIASRYFN